jgi:division protein CdvB (Snf7/Vps24/ESCRT-III family)
MSNAENNPTSKFPLQGAEGVLRKLQLLLKKYDSLKKENERLKKDLAEKEDAQNQYIEYVDELRQQVSILKASTLKMEEGDKKEFEKRINQYIKGIDKCIGLLSE